MGRGIRIGEGEGFNLGCLGGVWVGRTRFGAGVRGGEGGKRGKEARVVIVGAVRKGLVD